MSAADDMLGRMFLGLRSEIHSVADLPTSKQWYAQVLGIEPYFDEPFYVGFDVGGYELGLLPNSDGATGEGSITYWGVPDVDLAVQRLQELGATVHQEVSEVGGGIRLASLVDPGGNVVGVIENPHFALPE